LKKEDRLLRVGVLGAGLIAQAAHLEARNVELYALCDAAKDLVGKVAPVFEPNKTFIDYDAMLSDESVEAVIIGIADQFHVPMAIRAVEASKHVLVEKPMGVNVAECERFRDAVRARPGVHVQVGTMRRFDPGIAFAHDFIRDEVGQLLAIKAWYCDSIYRYQETDNLHPLVISSARAKRPAARFLGGELLAVRTDYQEKFDTRSWFVSVEFANGALGHLDLTLPVRMEWHEGFQVYGEYGGVVAKSVNPWYFKASEVECCSAREGQYRRPVGADGHTFRRQVEGFADVILNGSSPVGAQVEDGLAVLRALSAISHSYKTGQRVLLSEAPGEI
jgi:predicted dehydrogenase